MRLRNVSIRLIFIITTCAAYNGNAIPEASPNLEDKYMTYGPVGQPMQLSRLSEKENIQLQKTCGTSVSEAEDRITGGDYARTGQFPWAVSMATIADRMNWCSGVLISDRHVLTAIHCFYSYENDTTCRGIKFDTDSVRMLIHYGGVCIRNAEKDQCENQDTQTVQIKKVVLGKEFPETHCQSGNDVAIVELTEKIKLGGNVQAICLKNMSSDDMELPSYPTCGMNRTKLRHFTSIGWGRDDVNYSPAGLRFVHALPRCLRGNSIISVGMSNNRGSSSETRRGICIGDSGGPLQASDPNNGRAFLIGIQNKGQSCKDKELARKELEFYSMYIPYMLNDICALTGVCP
ncbi:trypsin domain-containing protein [Ditylenchus destructor]|uniref:Trypsin domain-containing protein n=1 Tax=Ditylenchus destructor TaxID=166010 RepID=A0AAD4MV16_9BILA|nr:trypsin domain-containing protein [Ditylenchus destructor]